MTNIKDYLQDGANYQARAVLCYIQPFSEIEESWDEINKFYKAKIKVARWENCREQGYIASLCVRGRQLNITWFEHRNSDSICAVKWEQIATNSLTIETAKFGDIYKSKYDVSHEVAPYKFAEMGDWILSEFKAFYISKSDQK